MKDFITSARAISVDRVTRITIILNKIVNIVKVLVYAYCINIQYSASFTTHGAVDSLIFVSYLSIKSETEQREAATKTSTTTTTDTRHSRHIRVYAFWSNQRRTTASSQLDVVRCGRCLDIVHRIYENIYVWSTWHTLYRRLNYSTSSCDWAVSAPH